MKNGLPGILMMVLALTTPLCFADDPHPLLSGYPGASIRNSETVDYEQFRMPLGLPQEDETYPFVDLKGDLSRHFYIAEGVSTLKVFENYRAALSEAGFSERFRCELESCGSYDQRTALGEMLSVENAVYNYHNQPYALVAETAAAKGRVFVAVFIGGYDGDAAIQQVVLEEEPLESGLIKVSQDYLSAQPAPTQVSSATPSDLDKDHPLFSRYPGARIYNTQTVDYETLSLPVALDPASEEPVVLRDVTGDLARHFYIVDNVSSLKVYENYLAALQQAGFTVAYSCVLEACDDGHQSSRLGGLMSVSGSVFNYYRKPYFVFAEKQGRKGPVYAAFYIAGAEDEVAIQQVIVETEQVETGLVAVDADSLLRDLDEKGTASVYGIYFEIDQAAIKPESRPALDEIARLLQKSPELLLYVVGHTDDTGALDHNLDLSQQRAAAVRTALVQEYQVKPERLIARGVGPFAPKATNTDTQGKTLNRRVELVRRLQ